jgi:hypothetical protein
LSPPTNQTRHRETGTGMPKSSVITNGLELAVLARVPVFPSKIFEIVPISSGVCVAVVEAEFVGVTAAPIRDKQTRGPRSGQLAGKLDPTIQVVDLERLRSPRRPSNRMLRPGVDLGHPPPRRHKRKFPIQTAGLGKGRRQTRFHAAKHRK